MSIERSDPARGARSEPAGAPTGRVAGATLHPASSVSPDLEPNGRTTGTSAARPRRRSGRPTRPVPEAVAREDVVRYLRRAAAAMARNGEYLNRLDAALGDGDHGENMLIGCRAAVRHAALDRRTDLGELLREIGYTLVASVGGASGPLYGTAFIEAGLSVQGADRIDLERLATAFEAATRGLARRGRCAVGDKTILDALEPAARSLRRSSEAGESLERALLLAAWAARRGMLATVPLVARRGLALRLGERSRGHQDPGATSCYLLVRALDPRSAGGELRIGHR